MTTAKPNKKRAIFRKKAIKVAEAAGIAMATTGLSTCSGIGAVDPAPPPLECNAVSAGQTLIARATLSGTTLQVTLQHEGQWYEASWVDDVTAEDLVGLTLTSVDMPEYRGLYAGFTLNFELTAPEVTAGSFTLVGELADYMDDDPCPVRRTFGFAIGADSVQVAEVSGDSLALPARQHAEIRVSGRDGALVEVAAHTPYRGARTVKWSATAGDVSIRSESGATWRLPSTPGFYQLELVIDFGDDGFAFDTLPIEVQPA